MRTRATVIALVFGVMSVMVFAACKKKKKSARNCGPAAQRTQQYLGALCKAQRMGITDPNGRLSGVKLASAPLAPSRTLPDAPLVLVGNRRLVIDNKAVKGWGGQWQKSVAGKPPGKPEPKPKAVKAAPPEKKPKAKVHIPRGDVKKGAGMLGVLGAMNKKLGTMFSRDKTVSADAEAALTALMGHSFVDEVVVKKLRALKGAGARKELMLAIASDTPADQVVTLLDLIQRAGYQRVSFLLAPKDAPRLPADPLSGPGKARLAPEPGQKWAMPTKPVIDQVARPWRDKQCKDVSELLTRLHKAGRVSDCEDLAPKVKKAITRCGCPVDERPLLSLLHRYMPPVAFVAVHRVTLSKTAKPLKVKNAAQPWSALSARVLKLDKGAFRVTGFSIKAYGVGVYKRKGPRVFMSRASVSGGLDAATIRRVIRRHISEVKYCYMSIGLPTNPKLRGMVKVSFTISPNGSVGQHVTIAQSTLNHGGTESCIKSAVRRWRFPKPEGSMPFVTYPFHFKP